MTPAVAESGFVLVGSSPSSDIAIDHPSVAPTHLRVRVRGDECAVRATRRDNVFFYNGRPTRAADLRVGENIVVGTTRLTFDGGRLVDTVAERAAADEDSLPPLLRARSIQVDMTGRGTFGANGIDLVVDAGEVLAVIGPSGAGKSTLVRALMGTAPAWAGEVYLRGERMGEGLPTWDIAFVPQHDVVPEGFTVVEALRMSARLKLTNRRITSELNAICDNLLEQLDLSRVRHNFVSDLSGGQRKRLSIAMELITKPSLLILDEPTSGLDAAMAQDLMRVLRAIAEGGAAVVVITHQPEDMDNCDRVLALSMGPKVGYFGPPSQLLPATETGSYAELMQFLHARKAAEPAPELAEPVQRVAAEDLPDQRVAQAVKRAGLSATSRNHQIGTVLLYEFRRLGMVPSERLRHTAKRISASAIAILAGAAVTGLAVIPTTRNGFDMGWANSIIAQGVAMFVVTISVLAAALSLMNVVRERDVVERQRRWGVSALAILIGRFVPRCLLAVTFAALAAVVIAVWRRPPPPYAGFSGMQWLVVIGVLVAVAGCSVGMAISSLARKEVQATYAFGVAAVGQVALSGTMIDVRDYGWGLNSIPAWIAWFSPARAGLVGLGSLVDMNRFSRQIDDLMRHPWTGLTTGCLVLIALTALYLLISAKAISALRPRQRGATAASVEASSEGARGRVALDS